MRKKLALLMIISLVGMTLATIPMNVGAAYVGDITILPGGGVSPAGAPIDVVGTEYILTDDIHGSITIQEPGITLNGAGYMLDGMGAGFRAVFLFGMNHVTVKNLVVQGWFIGIQLIASTDCTIMGNTVSDITRAGTALINSANDNVISGNSYTNCGWGMVCVRGSTGNVFSGNTAVNCITAGISVETTTGNVLNGNTFINCFYGIASGYATGVILMNNIMIDDSIVIWGTLLEHYNTHSIDTSNTVNGRPVIYWKDVTGGKVPGGAGQVILANCQNVQVKEQDVSYGSVGIMLAYCTDCQVKENIVSNSQVYGIFLQDSHENTVKENLLADNGYVGLVMEDSNDNTIKENKAVNSGEDGFWIITSSGNLIKENYAANGMWGIFLTSSSGNMIVENTVMKNSRTGIHLYQTSYDNTVCKNMIKKNWQGVVLDEGTYDNAVHHNNFFHNDIQARDEGIGNMWDDGSEGNYWSDYKGKDLDKDGVGDTDLPHAGVDWCPMMKPC
jgi:parallel beta-helix repeat protein